MSGLIVIGYDGTHDAGHAIDVAATILRASEAVVANVWRPAVVPAATMPLAAPATPLPSDEQDAQLERASVSNDTVREARRPILVVPSPDG